MKSPLPEKQLVNMCDGSKHVAGYVPLIEDNIDEETRDIYKLTPTVFASKRFTRGQMSLSKYAKELLAKHLAFDEFVHFWWGTKKLIIVMTGDKASTWFLSC